MSNLSRVVWSEGMYLGPHHFQAQNRYFEDSIQFTTNQVWFEPYGLLGCEFDREALANGTLALVHARGIFPDGLAFHMPEFDALPPARAISEAVPLTSEDAEVHLAVPGFRPDGLNCDLNGGAEAGARYAAQMATIADQNTGLDAKPIQLGRKNIRLVLGTELGEGMVSLPVARIRRHSAGAFVFDDSLIPPCLQIGASERLMLMLRRLLDALAEKCQAIARPRDLGARAASGFSAEGIANAWFLHAINASVGPLAHLNAGRRAHPERLFAELARLAGALCTFSLDSHPADLPLYDHMHPTACFEALDRHIRAHLELVVPSNRVPIPLENVAPFFYTGQVTDQRTLHQARWILAIRCRIGESEIIEGTPRLVKVCSKAFVPKLVERALPGMKLTHLQAPPPAVSPKVDFQYFAVDKAGPCWEHIIKTREVGVYVPGELPEPDIELSVILEN